MDEAKKILEMIEQGKITAAEGMELLDALKKSEPEQAAQMDSPKAVKVVDGKKVYQFLRVRVFTENDDTKVRVNIPLSLIKALGSMVNLNQLVPDDAKKVNGVDLQSIDIDAILRAIEEGTLEDGTIVDVEANDEHDGLVRVKIYVD